MNDLRFAFRQLLKNPGFTAVAVLTLALGIGANAAIFSVVNAVLLRPPPFKEPGRLVFVSEKSKDMDNMSVSYPNFLDWQRQQAGFSSLAAFRTEEWNLTGTSQPERVVGLQVSASFFPTLGVQPLRGRVFAADEDKIGGERVVVLSEGLWQRRFGADPSHSTAMATRSWVSCPPRSSFPVVSSCGRRSGTRPRGRRRAAGIRACTSSGG